MHVRPRGFTVCSVARVTSNWKYPRVGYIIIVVQNHTDRGSVFPGTRIVRYLARTEKRYGRYTFLTENCIAWLKNNYVHTGTILDCSVIMSSISCNTHASSKPLMVDFSFASRSTLSVTPRVIYFFRCCSFFLCRYNSWYFICSVISISCYNSFLINIICKVQKN